MEIGAFAAGVMVGGGSDKGAAVVEVIDPVRGLFSALQLASVGILFRPGRRVSSPSFARVPVALLVSYSLSTYSNIGILTVPRTREIYTQRGSYAA